VPAPSSIISSIGAAKKIMIGMTVLVKALVVLLWLVNFAQGFVVPTPSRSFGSTSCGGGGTPGIRSPPRRLVVSQQQSTLLSLADFDTMTLNWIGLAVGTMASLWVYQNDQNQEGESTSPSQPVMASSSTTLAPPAPKKETTIVSVAKPPVVPAKTTTTTMEAPPKPVAVVAAPVATKVMKETQKEINQKLQQVADKMQTTTAVQSEAPVFTEPYSDKVKLSVKRKSRFVGKLTRKVFMPWKAWSDL
jgi:hypothetical protein